VDRVERRQSSDRSERRRSQCLFNGGQDVDRPGRGDGGSSTTSRPRTTSRTACARPAGQLRGVRASRWPAESDAGSGTTFGESVHPGPARQPRHHLRGRQLGIPLAGSTTRPTPSASSVRGPTAQTVTRRRRGRTASSGRAAADLAHDPTCFYPRRQRAVQRRRTRAELDGSVTRSHPPRSRRSSVLGRPDHADQTTAEYYGTIFTIAESPRVKGLLWTGSAERMIHLTRDGGRSGPT